MDERWFTVQIYAVAETGPIAYSFMGPSRPPVCERLYACRLYPPIFEQRRRTKDVGPKFAMDFYQCPACESWLLVTLKMTPIGPKQVTGATRIAPGDDKTLKGFLELTEQIELL